MLCQVVQGYFALLAEAVDDAVARDAEQPGADLLDRLGQAIGFEEIEEDVLQDVFCLVDVRHALADEAAQPRALARHGLRVALVLFALRCSHRQLGGQCRIHAGDDERPARILW